MEIYLFLLILLIIATLMPHGKGKENFTLAIFVLMVFVCGWRGREVGTDTYSYWDDYKEVSFRMEPVFSALAWICKKMDFTPKGFLMTYAIITYIPFYLFLRKESKNIAFSLLIFLSFSVYFYHQTFNTVRAYAAIMFLLFSYYNLTKKNYYMALVFIMIGMLSHYSAIIIIPFLLLALLWKSPNFVIVCIIVLFSIVFGLTFASGFEELTNQVIALGMMYDNDVVRYYENSHLSNMSDSNLNIVGTLASLLPFSAYVILMYNKEISKSLYYKLFLFSVVLTNVFITIELTYRITMFFLILLVVVLPNAMRDAKGIRRTALMSLNVLMILWYLYQLFNVKKGIAMAGTIPYEF